jgi:transcriptional regulator with XRE-family HTH domain
MARNTLLICNLKTRRQTLGWSIDELADRCGIDKTALGDWEQGLSSPRLDAIEPWAAALGLTLELLSADSKSRHGLQVDWNQHCAKVDGTPIRLTPMEWKALEGLAWPPGELVTHAALFHHLYGDDRHHRAQSTAVRVLINKLRRLLPIRIEAQWGQGYVVSGLPPSRPPADVTCGNGAMSAGASPPPAVAPTPCGRVALTPTPVNSPPLRPEVGVSEYRMRRVAAAPIRPGSRRAEELGVIERFLAERGATRCPDLATIQQSPLPNLIWDKVKRKWVRPSMAGRKAS